MKTKFKLSTTFLAIILLVNSFTIQASPERTVTNSDPEKDKVIIYVLKNVLSRLHFVQKEINDDLSEQIFNSFIDALDSSKRYFTEQDIKEFSILRKMKP